MRTTLSDLKRWHSEQQPIAVMTCYDASFARVLEESAVDVLLIGDSLGMVLQGHPSPNPVTLEDVAYHTRCVVRGSQRCFILSDMPFGTSQLSPQETFRNAAILIQAGAQMIKIEGGSTDTVTRLEEHALHLSPQARSDSIPGLKIDTNNVQKAGHASTSGEVDDEQLFYMQARGIPKSDAVHMIVMGYFESVLDRIPLDTLREQVTADIAARI